MIANTSPLNGVFKRTKSEFYLLICSEACIAFVACLRRVWSKDTAGPLPRPLRCIEEPRSYINRWTPTSLPIMTVSTLFRLNSLLKLSEKLQVFILSKMETVLQTKRTFKEHVSYHAWAFHVFERLSIWNQSGCGFNQNTKSEFYCQLFISIVFQPKRTSVLVSKWHRLNMW